MAKQVIAAQFNEVRLAGSASGQALTTTETYVTLAPNTAWMTLTPRNFATAVVARLAYTPWLTVLKNQDALASEPIHASFLLQDGDTTNVLILNSMDTLANGDALYIGSHNKFGGVFVDVVNTNGNVSTLTVEYYNGALASISATDNTISSSHSLGQDGTVTWTVPADWVAASFNQVFGTTFGQLGGQSCDPVNNASYNDPMFWTRWKWSAALDSSVTVARMIGLERSSAYDEIVSGQALESSVHWGFGGISGVAALTDAGSANLLVQCATVGHGKFRLPASVDVG